MTDVFLSYSRCDRRAFVLDATGPAPPSVARGGTMRYEMCYAPQDAAIAIQVADALADHGHSAAQPGSEPTARLLVLSNATSAAFEPLRELRNCQLPTICIWTRYSAMAPQPTWRFVARQVVTVLLPATAAAVIVNSGDLITQAR